MKICDITPITAVGASALGSGPPVAPASFLCPTDSLASLAEACCTNPTRPRAPAGKYDGIPYPSGPLLAIELDIHGFISVKDQLLMMQLLFSPPEDKIAHLTVRHMEITPGMVKIVKSAEPMGVTFDSCIISPAAVAELALSTCTVRCVRLHACVGVQSVAGQAQPQARQVGPQLLHKQVYRIAPRPCPKDALVRVCPERVVAALLFACLEPDAFHRVVEQEAEAVYPLHPLFIRL